MVEVIAVNKDTIDTLVLSSMREFLENNEVTPSDYVGKVVVTENVTTMNFDSMENTIEAELALVILNSTGPEKGRMIYSNIITVNDEDTLESILDKIKNSFPSKEEIQSQREEARVQAEAQQAAQEAMLEQLSDSMPPHLRSGDDVNAPMDGFEPAVGTPVIGDEDFQDDVPNTPEVDTNV